MSKEVLIQCDHVSKKFCKDFKQSLWYGLKDVCSSFVGGNSAPNVLRSGEFWAVSDISFQLHRGECLGLIGHNGAGKSTLLKMLVGLIKPDQGMITMNGRIGTMIELGAGFNPLLTGRENIYNNGAVLGFSREEIDRKFNRIVDFSEIGDFIDSPVQNYSSGMKVRLGFAVAAQMEPDVLLIDEVLAVGDLGFIIKCLNRMGELIPNTATIFVSHAMPMIARICSQVLLMDRGKAIFQSNDVAEGLSRYVNMFESPKKINQGTGEISLIKIGIVNSSNRTLVYDDSAVLGTYDDLILEITLSVLPEVDFFDLFVTSFDGQLREVMASASSINGVPFRNDGREIRTFLITIPRQVLASGKYSVTFGAQNPKNKQFYCRVSNSIFFTMMAGDATWACTLIPGSWEEKII